jgi:hypothetical protein
MRAKSNAPGTAAGAGGISQARKRTVAPGCRAGVAAFSATLILSRGGKSAPADGRTTSRTASRAGSFCTLSIVGLERGHPRPLDPRRGDALGLPPDEATAHSRGQREDRDGPPGPAPRRERQAGKGDGSAQEQEARPGEQVREREPRRDACPEPDRKPERQLVPLGLEQLFNAGGQPK